MVNLFLWKGTARGKWNQGAKILARTRAFLAKCVFFLHLLHQRSYSVVRQMLMGEGFCFFNPSFYRRFRSAGRGDFEWMTEEVKEVKEKNTNVL